MCPKKLLCEFYPAKQRIRLDPRLKVQYFRYVRVPLDTLKHRISLGIVWALLLSMVSLLNVFYAAPMANASEVVQPTIKVRFVESGTALVSQVVNVYKEANEGSDRNSNLTTDANGEVTLALGNGYNYVYLNLSNSDDLTMTFGLYTWVKDGKSQYVYDWYGRTPTESNGAYVVEVDRPNVKGKITQGSKIGNGYIYGIWDVVGARWMNTPRWGITSSGNFYARLPVGKFLISVAPFRGQAGYNFSCTVTDVSIQTICDKEIPASNLKFNIFSGSNQLLSSDVYANLYKSDKEASQGFYLSPDENGLFASTLSDGNYDLSINSRKSDSDGMSARFSFAVSDGALSNITSSRGDTATATSGVYALKLIAPNFFGQVKANGVNATGGYAYAYQGKFWQDSRISSSGEVKFALPDGRNIIQINPSGSETPTVVSASFEVDVTNGSVTAVRDESGISISIQDSKYPLNFRSPNLVGQIRVNGSGSQGGINGVWSTVNNNWAKYQVSRIDEQGNYSILVPAGNYDVLAEPQGRPGGVRNCNVVSGSVTTCNFDFPADNFKFDVLSSGSSIVTTDLNVRIVPTTITRDDFRTYTLPFYTEYGVSANTSGRHSAALLDGTYRLILGTTNPNKYGTSRELTITVETGTVRSVIDADTKAIFTANGSVYALPLNTPNFKGIVKANSAISVGNYFYGYPNGGPWRWYSTSTNSQGQYAFTLPDGEYFFNINPQGTEEPPVVRSSFYVKVESSTVTSVVDSFTQETVALTSNGYELILPSANLKGDFTVSGAAAFDSYFYVAGILAANTKKQPGFQQNNYGQGKFALRAPPGDYRVIFVRDRSGFYAKNCTISDSVLNTCNADFPKPNLRFKIQSFAGEDLLSDVNAYSYMYLEDKSGGWGTGLNQGTGGVFETTLGGPEGFTYTLNVSSSVSPGSRGTNNNYDVTVNAQGVVTSVRDQKTGVEALSANGVYALKLAAPSIAGTVVGPDGTTPIPDTHVVAQGPDWSGTGTDKSGTFAFRVVDGTYTVYASAPWNDSTKVDSAKQTVVVTNGVGNNNLQLRLRTPNVVGTVSGPKGNSPYNYVQALKQDEWGNWNSVEQSRSADSSGKFVFYLEAGIYRFSAQGDEENAGGGSVVSDTCEVVNVNETKTCNIVLSSYNLKMKLLGSSGGTYSQASAYFYFEGNKDDLNARPLKTWDWSNSNTRGEMKFALTQGNWRGRIDIWGQGIEGPLDLRAVVDASGNVTTLESGSGTTFSKDSSGTYVVQLPSSNLTGTINFENKRVNFGSYVQVVKEVDNYYEYFAGGWSSAGKFAFVVPAGNYEILTLPYPDGEYSTGSPVQTKTTCVVPETGSVVCDVALRTGNFHGKIVRPSGDIDRDAHISIYEIVESNEKGTYEKWGNQTSLYNGLFSTYLDNGTYNVWVGPNWKSSGKYTSKLYRVVVSGNAISSVTDISSGSTVSLSDGRYPFALGAPSVTGRVLKPTGSTTIPYTLVLPYDSNGNELWQYATHTNDSGQFALNLPNGIYKLSARTWGDGYEYSNSAKVSLTVSGGVAVDVELRMRAPNLTGRVVSPSNSAVGISNVWINGFVDGQYFWGNTNKDGYFGTFIETTTALNCPANCSLSLHFWNNPTYASKSYSISGIGNVGSLTPGVVNAKVQVRIPSNGASDLASKWSWVSVQELNNAGSVIAEFGAETNELGLAGLSLTEGRKYRLVAYPSWEYYSRYSYKAVEIASFNATTNALTTITFDSPNLTLVVKDRKGDGNSWGWYEVYQGTGGSKTLYLDSYLNDQGRGALTLPDGTYTLIIYPGKASGVPLETTFTMTAGVPSGSGFGATGVGQFTLAGGNVSGKVFASDSSTVLASIPITAVRDDDNSITVSTVSQSDGYYELNLNRNYSWTLKAINPASMFKGSTALASGSASNEVASNKHIYLNTSVP